MRTCIFNFLLLLVFGGQAGALFAEPTPVHLTEKSPSLQHQAITENGLQGITNDNSTVSLIKGVVTWVDTNRDLLVLQTGATAQAFKLDLARTALAPGEEVVLEGVISKMTTAFPRYPEEPDGSAICASFEAPTNSRHFYLARMRGVLRVPVTGEYTFWIASDDSSELWLSEDAEPERARKIAFVETGRWTRPRQWRLYPSQQSRTIRLKAGVPYYIEALHQQGIGDDCLAVAWQGPTIKRSVIQGKYLAPCTPGQTNGWGNIISGVHGVLREYWTNFFLADLSRLRVRSSAIRRLRDVRVRQRDPGSLPKPMPVRISDHLAATNDFRRVELEGSVRFCSRTGDELRLELSDGSAVVQIVVKGVVSPTPLLPDHSLVQVCGVGELIPGSAKRRRLSTIWSDTPNAIVWLDTDENWNRFPRMPAYLLTSSNFSLVPGQLIHLQGWVKAQQGKDLWLMHGDDTFRGYVSSNGVTWSAVGPPVEFAMSNSVLAGFSVSSHQTNGVAVARFANVQGLSSTLKASEVGAPPIPGSNASDSNSLVVRGSGSDFWGASDQGHFAWQKFSGDAEFAAHLGKFNAGNDGAKIGLMIRQSLDPQSPWAAMVIMPNHKVGLQARRERENPAAGALATTPADWIKLTRTRNVFRIQTRPGAFVHPGQRLDVLGFLTWEQDVPVLQDARFREIPGESQSTNVEPQSAARNATTGGFLEVEIKDLKKEAEEAQLAGHAGRFRIRGVVTFNGPVAGEPVFVVQDGSAGCPIQFRGRQVAQGFHVGDLVEATGSPAEGDAAPVFLALGMSRVGVGQLPYPQKFPFELGMPPQQDSQWVEVEGVARTVNSRGELIVATHAGDLPVLGGDDATAEFSKLVDASVRIRGVYWANPVPMLLPSASFVDVLQFAPSNPFQRPAFSAAAIHALKLFPAATHRMKLHGVVTCKRSGFFVLQDGTGGILVHPATNVAVKLGEQVAVVGFPTASQYGVILTEALVRHAGMTRMPEPVALPSDVALDERWNQQLVDLEAVLLEQHSVHGVQYMDLQAGQRAFRATLPVTGGRLDAVTPGSLVRVTGIAQIEEAASAGNQLDKTGKPLVASLELLLRSANDLTVLKRPPWWNWKYTAGTIALFCAALLTALIWIKTLHRRVEERTHELRDTMVKLQRETQISATLAERDRLAGEIHDSIEQGLSAIMMQMDAAAKRVNQPEEVARFLTLAKNMAGFSRSEVQHAVWDMQSPLLENTDLATALRRVAGEISAGDSPRVTVEITGQARALPSSIEHHLLRIGQEAITNAVKHARPDTIQLWLDYEANWVTLTVEDNGCGFDPNAVQHGHDHFGLQGIRTRGRKINAVISLSSQPGQGVRIVVKVPLAATAANAATQTHDN